MKEKFIKVFTKLGEITNNLLLIYIALQKIEDFNNINAIEFYQEKQMACLTILSILQIEKVTSIKEYLEKKEKQIKSYFKELGNGKKDITIEFDDSYKDSINRESVDRILHNLDEIPQAIQNILKKYE